MTAFGDNSPLRCPECGDLMADCLCDDCEELVAEDTCDLCGEFGEIIFCTCGAEICVDCMEGHSHVTALEGME